MDNEGDPRRAQGSGKTGLFIGGAWFDGPESFRSSILPPKRSWSVSAWPRPAMPRTQCPPPRHCILGPLRPLVSAPRSSAELSRPCAREDDLAEFIVLENGKAFSDALGEVRYAAEFFRWFSEEAPRIGGGFAWPRGGTSES